MYRAGLKLYTDDDVFVGVLVREDNDDLARVRKIYDVSVDEDGEWDVAQAVLEGLIVDPLLPPHGCDITSLRWMEMTEGQREAEIAMHPEIVTGTAKHDQAFIGGLEDAKQLGSDRADWARFKGKDRL